MTSSYVLITPARNEEKHIGRVLNAVTMQTALPVRYIIVSDGSTDKTDAIVEKYAGRFSFVELVRIERETATGFGSKALAFNAGHDRIIGTNYNFIGNVDADVSFEADYFSRILAEFKADKKLGLAGGLVYEHHRGRFIKQKVSDNSVAGPVQLFRRTCFEEIGGYIPMKFGGIDSAAEIMVRMHGWHVRTIRTCKVLAHRPVLTGKNSILRQRFNKGVINYLLGYHPLLQSAILIQRITDYPFIVGSILTFAGYLWAFMRKPQRQVSPEFIEYLRKEQLKRLNNFKIRLLTID